MEADNPVRCSSTFSYCDSPWRDELYGCLLTKPLMVSFIIPARLRSLAGIIFFYSVKVFVVIILLFQKFALPLQSENVFSG